MPRLEFTQNWNGKLFLDVFGTVRLHNEHKYYLGAEHDVFLKNTQLGIVTVVAVRTFRFGQIRDVISFLDMGKPPYYMADVMKRMYSNKIAVNNDTEFDHIILQYKEKKLDAMKELLESWWKDQQDTYTKEPIQPTLFD